MSRSICAATGRPFRLSVLTEEIVDHDLIHHQSVLCEEVGNWRSIRKYLLTSRYVNESDANTTFYSLELPLLINTSSAICSIIQGN